VARRMVVLAVAFLMAMTGVAHAQYIPGQPGFTITPDTCPDTGCDVVISGVGCPPATEVNAYLIVDGREVFIGSGVSEDDPDGAFEFGATIPPVPAGEYTVLVRCGPVSLSNIITITSTAVIRPPLPRTGSDILGLLRIALVLLAIGGLLLVSERKRRRHATA
jgi:hypothetical protein